MRVPAAAATALASFALLSSAWHLGAAPALVAGPAPVAVVIPSTAPTSREPTTTEPATTDPPGGTGAAAPPTRPPRPTSSATPPTETSVPVVVTADGAVVPTRYGDVQVQVVVQDGRLVDVVALQLTDVDGTSRRISADAAPLLRREALDTQSAQVDTVSSATYTSEAYRQSLQSALDAAAAAAS